MTLFDDHRALDAEATADLAARLVELGADAIVVAGTTGEADALDDDERLRLFSAVRAAVGDAVVVGGTGAASTHQAAALTARAPDTGVDAVIARTPRGLADPSGFYRALADAAGTTPVLAYHFPAVSPPGIPGDAALAARRGLQGLLGRPDPPAGHRRLLRRARRRGTRR